MNHKIVWLLVVCLCLACISDTALGQNIEPKALQSLKIAFVRNGDIWVASGNGSNQKPIITWGSAPAWSPSKKQIAFARGNNVWIADADGTHQKCLTHFKATKRGTSNGENIEISWRPGTNQITFSHSDEFAAIRTEHKQFTVPSNERSVYAMSIFDVGTATRSKEQVRYDIYSYAGDIHFSYHTSPSWSQDSRLFFVRNGDIWIANRNANAGGRPGWDVTRLAAVAQYDAPTYRADTSNHIAMHLSTSPNGKYLAYAFGRASYDSVVRLLNLKRSTNGDISTGDTKLLSEPDTMGIWPSFSPDSKYVAYQTTGPTGPYEIWAVSVETGDQIRLIKNGEQPTW